MRLLIASLFLISICFQSLAQSPQIYWQHSYGGTGGELGLSIKEDSASGFIVAGQTNSIDGDVVGLNGGADIWVLRLDSTGNNIWKYCLGGSQYDIVHEIIKCANGGYLMVGNSLSNDGDVSGNHSSGSDFWIVNLSSSGNIIWQKCYGGTNDEMAYSATQLGDGGYLILGQTNSNDGDVSGNITGQACWLIRIDSIGSLMWQKCIPVNYGVASKYSLSFQSNGITISGDNLGDYWIARLDTLGNLIWQESFGGSSGDRSFCTIPTSDNGYLMVGKTYSNDGDVLNNQHWMITGESEIWVLKLDSLGDILSQRCLGGTGNDEALSAIQTFDGDFIIGGWTMSYDGDVNGNHGSDDFWIVQLDSTLNLIWQKCVGGSGNEQLESIIETSQYNIVATGFSSSNDGDVSGNHGFVDLWVVNLTSISDNISSTPISITDLTASFSSSEIQVCFYSFKKVHSEIQLFDVTGRLLLDKSVDTNIGFNKFSIPCPPLSTGIYFVKIDSDIIQIFANF